MHERPEPAGLGDLAAAIGGLGERFVEAGHRLYLVGGIVRDLFIAADRPFSIGSNDIDLTTDAEPPAIKRLVSPLADAVWTQGERFGTIGAMVGGQAIEITTHRAEAYDADSRKPVVSFGTDLGEDLSRRDFTINAAAIELPSRILYDPFDGIADLAAGVLRTPLGPEVSFSDDPLRMMRAARFIARFALEPTPELVSAAWALAERLTIVSVERTADELERLLALDRPSPGLEFLIATGLLGYIVPAYREDEAAARFAVALAGGPGGATVRRAGLLWPVAAEAGEILNGLRYSRADRTATTRLLRGAELALAALDRPGSGAATEVDLDGIGPAAVRRIAAVTGADHLDDVVQLLTNLAITAGRVGPGAPISSTAPTVAAVEAIQRTVAVVTEDEDLSDLSAPLTGTEIMETLGLEPGPEVGLAERHLRELRLERGPMTPTAAREELQAWARERRGSGPPQ